MPQKERERDALQNQSNSVEYSIEHRVTSNKAERAFLYSKNQQEACQLVQSGNNLFSSFHLIGLIEVLLFISFHSQPNESPTLEMDFIEYTIAFVSVKDSCLASDVDNGGGRYLKINRLTSYFNICFYMFRIANQLIAQFSIRKKLLLLLQRRKQPQPLIR